MNSSDKESLIKVEKYLNDGKIEEAKIILTSLELENNPKFKYLSARLFYDLGMKYGELEYLDKAITFFKQIKEQDFDFINYYLGTLYVVKYELLDSKPDYLQNKDLLFNSKLELKKELSKNHLETFREANIHLGNVYSLIGRRIDALDYFENVLERFDSAGALYNKAYALYIYSSFTDNPSLILRDAYQYFKIILNSPHLDDIYLENSNRYSNEILEIYDEEFLNSDVDGEIEIEVDNEFELFMINYCWENRLFLNLCNLCQRCKNSIGDTIVIEKMINEVAGDGEDDLFLVLSSYLNQLKMDYVSARFLLVLSQYDDFDLDIITKHVYIVDTQFCEENNIRIQLLKDSFKNFFNILDKIAYFMNDYLKLGVSDEKINFRSVWFKNGFKNQGANEKLLERNNDGLTALYDIYLEVEYGNEKEYLRNTRNSLTHKYLRITKDFDENSKSIEDLQNETIEIAILAKNAIIYLMRLVKINEEQKENELGIEFKVI